MTKALIVKKDEKISFFSIKGHANAGKYGNDLVCAALTGIVNGSLNALNKKFTNDVLINIKENVISIEVKNMNKSLNDLLEFMIIQLETIEIQYPNNFKIERMT